MSFRKMWAGSDDAGEALSISVTRLRELKRTGELQAGTHWVYLTGKRSGPIGWDIEAIQLWQRDITRRIENETDKKLNDILISSNSHFLRVIPGGYT